MLGDRTRSRFRLPITLSASLIAANAVLMVLWIYLFARSQQTGALTVGAIAFMLILVGLSFWLVLTVKEIRLNHRQANFVDSVTHELKSPIAALQLSLETLRRPMGPEQRAEFHDIMTGELARLDRLINQLLEVGRLDALGRHQAEESVPLVPLLKREAEAACVRHGQDAEATVRIEGELVNVPARPLMLQMVISNLVDNAFKYGGSPPEVLLRTEPLGPARVRLTVASNGERVKPEDRRRIFRVFERGGPELERKKTGTGLGLYIVSTLVKRMRGRIEVRDVNSADGIEHGTAFVVELPGRAEDGADVDSPDAPSEQLTAV